MAGGSKKGKSKANTAATAAAAKNHKAAKKLSRLGLTRLHVAATEGDWLSAVSTLSLSSLESMIQESSRNLLFIEASGGCCE